MAISNFSFSKNSVRGFLPALLVISSAASMQGQIVNPKNIHYNWRTDTSKRVVELHEFQAVAPRKTFPIIDFPKFIDKTSGLDHYFKYEPVIAVEMGGMAKAYPLNILTMHELSNDTIAGIPILPTYCPLCNSSVVFDRRVKVGDKVRILDFEVSGMLRMSDMVMFDRQTETWWQQLTGEGEVGDYAGQMLDIIPSMIVSVSEFFESYPEGQIMDFHTQTESEQRYGSNPYFHYDSIGAGPYVGYFAPEKVDARLPAMERVVDVHGDLHDKIYPFSEIAKLGVVNDSVDDSFICIFYHNETVSVLDDKEISKSKKIGTATVFDAFFDGRRLTFKVDGKYFRDDQTGSRWDITGHCIEGDYMGKRLWAKAHSNDFAFAFLAFHPDAIIWHAE